jgi:cell division protein FtsB
LKEQIALLQQNIKLSIPRTNVNMAEFENLQEENIKLKHRIEILKKVSFEYISKQSKSYI